MKNKHKRCLKMLLKGLDMGFDTNNTNVKKIRLGDYISRSTTNNRELKYGSELIEGVTSEGVFSVPKGDNIDVDLKPYKIVHNGAFVYNPSRLNLGSIAYRTKGMCIVSHLYIVFYLNDKGKQLINPDWLYMYFRRKEFYREVTFRNFGSQRPEFNYNDMSEIIIPLPDLATQQKYVDVYNAMVANQKCYERGLDDLRLVIEGFLEQLMQNSKIKAIGDYIEIVDRRNENLKYGLDSVKGISNEKEFIETKANMNGVDLRPYKIVAPLEFVYVPVTSRNGGKITLAINDTNNDYIFSSSYITFRCSDKSKLFPDYLMLFFNRPEFDRYARFHSWGSARETFEWEEMCDVKIPLPDIEVQKSISDIHKVYVERKKINEKLKEQIKEMCPILIKGSLEDRG